MDNFKKQVIKSKELLHYQDNAIVSNTILKNGSSSITLFAFDQGQEINTHSAPMDATVFVLEGTVEIIISGEKFSLEEGDFIIMPKDQPHALLAKTKMKMMLFK